MEHCFDWAPAEARQRQGAVPQAKLPGKNGRHSNRFYFETEIYYFRRVCV